MKIKMIGCCYNAHYLDTTPTHDQQHLILRLVLHLRHPVHNLNRWTRGRPLPLYQFRYPPLLHLQGICHPCWTVLVCVLWTGKENDSINLPLWLLVRILHEYPNSQGVSAGKCPGIKKSPVFFILPLRNGTVNKGENNILATLPNNIIHKTSG